MSQPFSTYAIDNTKLYAVIANTYCRRVVVQENYDSANPPTADLEQYNPDGSGPVLIPKGTPAVFSKGPYTPGTQVGSIETVSGSITVQQIESMEV